jgi:hypothetical protein
MRNLFDARWQNVDTRRRYRAFHIRRQIPGQELCGEESLAAQRINYSLPLLVAPQCKANLYVTLLAAPFLYLGYHTPRQHFQAFHAAGAAVASS